MVWSGHGSSCFCLMAMFGCRPDSMKPWTPVVKAHYAEGWWWFYNATVCNCVTWVGFACPLKPVIDWWLLHIPASWSFAFIHKLHVPQQFWFNAPCHQVVKLLRIGLRSILLIKHLWELVKRSICIQDLALTNMAQHLSRGLPTIYGISAIEIFALHQAREWSKWYLDSILWLYQVSVLIFTTYYIFYCYIKAFIWE